MAYSMWATAGAGQATEYWGFLLLLGWVPVDAWIVRHRSL